MNRFKWRGLWFAGLLACMPLAHAVSPGIALGFNIGTADDAVLDETDSAYKISLAFNGNQNLGLELAYVDLGEYAAGTLEQSGLAFNLLGYLPVGNSLALLGKLGLFDWQVDFLGVNVDEGTDLTYGLGLQLDFAPQLAARVEWEEFTDISGGDVSLLSAGIVYSF